MISIADIIRDWLVLSCREVDGRIDNMDDVRALRHRVKQVRAVAANHGVDLTSLDIDGDVYDPEIAIETLSERLERSALWIERMSDRFRQKLNKTQSQMLERLRTGPITALPQQRDWHAGMRLLDLRFATISEVPEDWVREPDNPCPRTFTLVVEETEDAPITRSDPSRSRFERLIGETEAGE